MNARLLRILCVSSLLLGRNGVPLQSSETTGRRDASCIDEPLRKIVALVKTGKTTGARAAACRHACSHAGLSRRKRVHARRSRASVLEGLAGNESANTTSRESTNRAGDNTPLFTSLLNGYGEKVEALGAARAVHTPTPHKELSAVEASSRRQIQTNTGIASCTLENTAQIVEMQQHSHTVPHHQGVQQQLACRHNTEEKIQLWEEALASSSLKDHIHLVNLAREKVVSWDWSWSGVVTPPISDTKGPVFK